MDTKVLVLGSEPYIDRAFGSVQGIDLRCAYFLGDALKAVQKDTPDIIVLHVVRETGAIFNLRMAGFAGFIIADSSENEMSEIAGSDYRTATTNEAVRMTLKLASSVQVLLNRYGERSTLIQGLKHYTEVGLDRVEALMFLTKPHQLLAMKIANYGKTKQRSN